MKLERHPVWAASLFPIALAVCARGPRTAISRRTLHVEVDPGGEARRGVGSVAPGVEAPAGAHRTRREPGYALEHRQQIIIGHVVSVGGPESRRPAICQVLQFGGTSVGQRPGQPLGESEDLDPVVQGGGDPLRPRPPVELFQWWGLGRGLFEVHVPLCDGGVRLDEAARHRCDGRTRSPESRGSGGLVIRSEEEHDVVGHPTMIAVTRSGESKAPSLRSHICSNTLPR